MNLGKVSFKGTIVSHSHDKDKKLVIETFETNKKQDELIKLVANSLSDNDNINREITSHKAAPLTELIRMITGAELKESAKMNIRINENRVVYGNNKQVLDILL